MSWPGLRCASCPLTVYSPPTKEKEKVTLRNLFPTRNTGHDFGGRSTGAGSLSVWVHPLKDIEFIPRYAAHGYDGMAVRVGAGVESWEMANFMSDHNITVLIPGGSTVGVVGGWMAAGGHGGLTSKLGLGSDQVLSINVVTADGRFVTADPETNEDLWWALRGGGPSRQSLSGISGLLTEQARLGSLPRL